MNRYASAISASIVVLAATAFTSGQASLPTTHPKDTLLFVAADGNDANTGTIDKPFATLERARDEVRRLRKAKAPAGPVTVNIRAGTYYLERTFKLSAEDSGTVAAPVVYRGYGKERPVLVGGRPISGFTPYKDHILVADVANQGLKGVAFRQLFFDGRRQVLARYPNHDARNPHAGGWAYVDGKGVPMNPDLPDDSKRVLTFKAEDARTWARCADGEVCVFPRYNYWNNIVQIASIDREKRQATLAGDCSFAIRPGDRYFVQGMIEELDAPGEWYLDQGAGKLYFWPPSPLEGKPVIAPALRTIIDIDQRTSHVTIQGFDIECCEGTAVKLTNATDCLMAGCIIRNVGDYNGCGVQIHGGLRNGVVGCNISEVGRDGIDISSGDCKTLSPGDNYADNNYIHHVGVFYKQGVGVQLNGVGNRASHNLIHDGPRMGIIFSGNNQLIEYNHIRHMDLETEDTGGIYTCPPDWISARGSVIRYNYIHDMIGFGKKDGRWISPYYAWGIYLDNCTSGVDVIGNIVARCPLAGLNLHNGRDNLVENNIFIDNGLYQAEYNGWTESSSYWKDTFPAMVKGYESVAKEPAWQSMRGMKTHPKDAILPGGLIMSGNVLSTNIFYYRDPAANLYRFSNVPFDHNEADRNLVWHGGLPIATGQFKAGKAISGNLLANPGFEEGVADEMPKGWSWQARPRLVCDAATTQEASVEGKRSLKIDALSTKTVPAWPVVVSDEVPAQGGHTYHLKAKMKAAKDGTRVSLAVQSYVAQVYFWCVDNPFTLGTDWKECEVVAKLPAKGEQGFHELMKTIRARLDLQGGEGTVWIDDMSLVEVESVDEWKALQATGFDRNSLVADPLFVAPEKDNWRLKSDSPAFRLGFKAIPIEKIGPYEGPLRVSWPIVEAPGERERLARPAGKP